MFFPRNQFVFSFQHALGWWRCGSVRPNLGLSVWRPVAELTQWLHYVGINTNTQQLTQWLHYVGINTNTQQLTQWLHYVGINTQQLTLSTLTELTKY